MTELSDERAREAATDPGRSVLLQAPAGSGKTTVLTQRLLRLLASVDEPEEILAITFTRKAAAEMRGRVLKALRGDIDTSNSHGKRLRVHAEAALKHAAARGWNLADDPGRLRIQTIDSFNFRLASQLPVTARAGGSLVISDRPYELYARAARHTLIDSEDDEVLAADAELLFERLDNQWRNVERLLADMLQKRGHWLRYVLGHEPAALSARINDSLAGILRDRLALAAECVSHALRQEASALPHVGSLGDEPACLPAWKQLARLSQTAKGEWRQPAGINRRLGPGYEDAASRDALRACIGRLGAVRGAREILQDLQALPGPALTPSDAAAIEALSRLLRSAAAHLQAEFSIAGRVDHTYVAGAARLALAEEGLPTDLALRTGLSLRHVLIDEFQDTSLAQFDLIESLTAGWEEGDGRTLFVVGDPMQSIYQFREAEVGLFLRARDRGIGAVRLEPLRLLRNFRSVPGLIEWTNVVFPRLFPATDDLRASAVAFTPSLPARGESPGPVRTEAQLPLFEGAQPSGVQLQVFPAGDRDAEANAICERIRELRRHEPQSTIAVLVAARTHAVPIMEALEARMLPAIGVELVPLTEVPIVRDLVSLLRALHHLGDRTAWLAVLRAPWCGVSLATLTELSQRSDSSLIWEALSDATRLARCSAQERARIARLRDVLAATLAEGTTAPIADHLEATWLRLGGADAYPAQELRHARAFLAALSERVTSGEWRGTSDLDSLLAGLFAEPDSSSGNPVQVMTIHRAKGLEFDHVLVPSLDRDRGRGREPLLRWLDLPRAEGASDLVMAPVPIVGDDSGGEVSGYLKRLISRRSANERARLLYVATTRARQTLFLSGAPRATDDRVMPRGGTLLALLWPVLGEEFAATVRAEDAPMLNAAAGSTQLSRAPATGTPKATGQSLRRLSLDWTPAELDAPAELPRLPLAHQSLDHALEFSWVQETARSIGTVVHAALERFAGTRELPQSGDIEARRGEFAHQLRRHGVPERELQRAVGVVVDALSRTLDDPRGRWILSSEHAEARSELALTGLTSGRLTNVVIDRSFVSEGTRWVIDFKTSAHEGGGLESFLDREMDRYQGQLRGYVELARGVGPHPVRAALYFPLLRAFRELPQKVAAIPNGRLP